MKGVILHGGHGTRLRPLTHTGPKQLIPVANKPMSQYVLEDLRDSGIEEIAIIVGDIMPEKVQSYYRDGREFDVKTTYIHQKQPGGIAQAISLAENFVGDSPFVVYLGDNLLKGSIGAFVKEFKDSNDDAMVLLCEVENPKHFGVAEFDKNGKLVKLVEKPKKPPSNYALTGIYFLKPIIFKMIKALKPSWRGELEITEALQGLLDAEHKVGYKFVTGWWKDTGTVGDILEANRLVLDDLKEKTEGTVEEKPSIQGRVAIGKETVVKRGALIRGPVIIGNHTIIGEQVYIGPYTSIGNNVKIKRGEIENSIIMNGCCIEINGKITDSLIGAGTTLATNQKSPKGYRLVVGENSRIIM
ncbi:MAG: glucose-1-phosphate thymidylyltransferase [Candidatus Bathyarchaeota archaeon]|nr:glucose-1-phosphate thymidylyltransferase [Candidatus Bathyarchaeota archaeon]MDH5494187.1 glucose-1-phosphate thymidylyltransferase [Candidatus Bathyarchaeota archaeon]